MSLQLLQQLQHQTAPLLLQGQPSAAGNKQQPCSPAPTCLPLVSPALRPALPCVAWGCGLPGACTPGTPEPWPSLLQACQRYWTEGGTLRDMAPGAGKRKSKSAKLEQQASSAGPDAVPPAAGVRATGAAAAAAPAAVLLPPAPLQLAGAASLSGVPPPFPGLDPAVAALGMAPVSIWNARRAALWAGIQSFCKIMPTHSAVIPPAVPRVLCSLDAMQHNRCWPHCPVHHPAPSSLCHPLSVCSRSAS